MNGKTLRALIDAGAIKRVYIIADGSMVYVEVQAGANIETAQTTKGGLKTWRSIDAAAKWIRSLGIGSVQLDISAWKPEQRGLKV